jgi:Zn-dependent protease
MMPIAFLLSNPPGPEAFIAIALVIFFGLGLHEYSHAKFADMAGDPTPSYYGRVTLNLTKHFDPIGTIMIIITSLVGVGIGWGKPVPMDPRKMKNPRWDHFVAVAAGPLSNLLQAIFWALVWRILVSPGVMSGQGHEEVRTGQAGILPALLYYGVLINLSLMIFNLIPLGPLDGMWLFGTFLSEKARLGWTKWNLGIGQFAFLGLVLLDQLTPFKILSVILFLPVFILFRILTGASL